jgi:hypothetical protein
VDGRRCHVEESRIGGEWGNYEVEGHQGTKAVGWVDAEGCNEVRIQMEMIVPGTIWVRCFKAGQTNQSASSAFIEQRTIFNTI